MLNIFAFNYLLVNGQGCLTAVHGYIQGMSFVQKHDSSVVIFSGHLTRYIMPAELHISDVNFLTCEYEKWQISPS